MWTTLSETRLDITTPAMPEWVQLAQASLAIGVPSLPPAPPPVPTPAWILLAQSQISIAVPGVIPPYQPPVPPTIPPEKAEFPWIPVALIGGGLVVAATSIKPVKKKET